jgi:rhodanese-related sulfurtransferase
MKRLVPTTLEGKLALTALTLGLLALFGNPYRGETVTVATQDLAWSLQQAERLSAPDLADRLISGRTDHRILDLRSAEAYAEYHVPGAESAPVAHLADYPLYRNETVVLYGDDAVGTAQAWLLLQARGYRGAVLLDGGLDAWKERVLFPALPEGSAPEAVTRAKAVAEHFGGQARVGGAAVRDAPVELPKVEAPAAVAPAARRPTRREGC